MEPEILSASEESVLFSEADREVLADNLRTEKKQLMNLLLGCTGFYFISTAIEIMVMPSDAHLDAAAWITIAFFILLQLAFSLIAPRYPMTGVIGSIALFVLLQTLIIIADGPENLFKGIWMKAIMIYFLIKAFRSAREISSIKKEMALFGQA